MCYKIIDGVLVIGEGGGGYGCVKKCFLVKVGEGGGFFWFEKCVVFER